MNNIVKIDAEYKNINELVDGLEDTLNKKFKIFRNYKNLHS